MSKTITITGAAGQIGYQLAFRIPSGQLLGTETKVNLKLLEISPALEALKGVAMELEDCAFQSLGEVIVRMIHQSPLVTAILHSLLELNQGALEWSEVTY